MSLHGITDKHKHNDNGWVCVRIRDKMRGVEAECTVIVRPRVAPSSDDRNREGTCW